MGRPQNGGGAAFGNHWARSGLARGVIDWWACLAIITNLVQNIRRTTSWSSEVPLVVDDVRRRAFLRPPVNYFFIDIKSHVIFLNNNVKRRVCMLSRRPPCVQSWDRPRTSESAPPNRPSGDESPSHIFDYFRFSTVFIFEGLFCRKSVYFRIRFVLGVATLARPPLVVSTRITATTIAALCSPHSTTTP